MKRTLYTYVSYIMFFFTQQGCINPEPLPVISPELRNSNFIPADSIKPTHRIEVVNCTEPTLYRECNLDCDFEQALKKLSSELAKIPDSLRLLKALSIADFVYAAFSYEYLHGINYQPEQQLYKWDTLPIDKCFDFGNRNIVTMSCGESSFFFQKLLDTLTPFEYFEVSIVDKHTFPVVNIGSKSNPQWYIIDPYDPFVVIDANDRILDMFSLWNGKRGIVYRTKRKFGPTRLLVADSLLLNMASQKKDFCNMVSFTDSIFDVFKVEMGADIENIFTFNFNQAGVLPKSEHYTYVIEDFGRAPSFYFAQLYDWDKSVYLGRNYTVCIPAKFENNHTVLNAVSQLQSMMPKI